MKNTQVINEIKLQSLRKISEVLSKNKTNSSEYRVLLGWINQEFFLYKHIHPSFMSISEMAMQEYDLNSDFINAIREIKKQIELL